MKLREERIRMHDSYCVACGAEIPEGFEAERSVNRKVEDV